MNIYKKEKEEAEKVIKLLVKKMPDEEKQRAADILLGMTLTTKDSNKQKQT